MGEFEPISEDQVVLVDEQDNPVGTCAKLAAHQNGGRLHRAFSIFLFDDQGRMLLQQRAAGKYHFGGLWSNTCCSHPKPGETVKEAARRRLQFEMGIDIPLEPAFSFVYRAEDPSSGLVEHELDHVLIGDFGGAPQPNPDEVQDWKWMEPADILQDLDIHPQHYTPWFKIVLQRVLEHRAR